MTEVPTASREPRRPSTRAAWLARSMWGAALLLSLAGAILFAVSDDGTGIDPERVARGMGLDIMQDRMEALGGTLEVASSPGLGTTVIGRVPTRVVESVGS